jgi:hypothetical protein
MPDKALEASTTNVVDQDDITIIKSQVMDLILLSEQKLSIRALIESLPAVTNPCYLLPNGLRYIDTYEYQLLEQEVRETKSKDLLNILATIMTNYMIHNDYLDKTPNISLLQNQIIMNTIDLFSREYGF